LDDAMHIKATKYPVKVFIGLKTYRNKYPPKYRIPANNNDVVRPLFHSTNINRSYI